MAEYYPLLAKAVAGLPNSTPEARRAVYERARKALLGQLQNLQPPVPEADVARETEALDAAMARLEAELSGANGAGQDAAPPGIAAPKTAEPKPVAPPRAAAPPLRPQAPARRTNGNGALGPNERQKPPPRGAEAAPGSLPPATMPDPPRMRFPEGTRPYAPQPEPDDVPQNRRLWIVIGVVIVVVALVALAAWKLRDRPGDLSAFKTQTQSQPDKIAGKIDDRVGGPAPQADSQSSAPRVTSEAPANTTSAPAPAAAAPATAQKADSNSSVPVAYRAALLVEAPDEPNKVKTYVGTVIWKLENVSNGPGQALATAVHADIDVPDDKLKATLDIQKNTDPSLSASHTITIVFTVAPDSPTGAIKQISVPQMRREDNPNGEPLKGILVPIMDNSFLIGLSRGDAEAANIDMIKQLEWFDIPILLNNGRVAKLTFEKNTSGARAIQDALNSWQTQQ